jgi:hypothetical protein
LGVRGGGVELFRGKLPVFLSNAKVAHQWISPSSFYRKSLSGYVRFTGSREMLRDENAIVINKTEVC